LSAVRAELREHSVTAARALVQLLDDPDPGTRLRAIEIFYDRLCGKPVASIEQDIRHLDVGAAIRGLWLQTVQQPPVPPTIEGEANITTITDVAADPTTIATPLCDGADATNEW
jgi:hypothetical protein